MLARRLTEPFYDATFAAFGGKEGFIDPRGRIVYEHNGGRFLVSKPIDGEEACHANGGTIEFLMNGPKDAEAWHGRALRMGALQSKILPASAKVPPVSYISLTFAIPTATSCVRCIACRDVPQP